MDSNTYTWRKVREAYFTFFGSRTFHSRSLSNHWFLEWVYNMCVAKESILIAIIIFFHEFFFVPFKVIEKDSKRCGGNLWNKICKPVNNEYFH